MQKARKKEAPTSSGLQPECKRKETEAAQKKAEGHCAVNLGLLLGTEAPVMMSNGVDFTFLSLCSGLDAGSRECWVDP